MAAGGWKGFGNQSHREGSGCRTRNFGLSNFGIGVNLELKSEKQLRIWMVAGGCEGFGNQSHHEGSGCRTRCPIGAQFKKKSQRCARFGVDGGVHRSGLRSARASETVMMTSAQPEGYRKIAIMRWRFLPAVIKKKKTYQKDEWRRRRWNRERRGTQRNDNNQINSVRLKETWLTPSTSPSSSWPRWFDPAGRYDRADRKLIPQL